MLVTTRSAAVHKKPNTVSHRAQSAWLIVIALQVRLRALEGCCISFGVLKWKADLTWSFQITLQAVEEIIMPALALAVLAYSDGSQFRFTAELQLTWLVTWAMREEDPPHPHPPPVGHQELRVEITWAMRRRTPCHIGHQELRVEVTWAVRRSAGILRPRGSASCCSCHTLSSWKPHTFKYFLIKISFQT